MRLSWNEIRARAASFSEEWKDGGYEKGQTQLFYRDFLDVFGVPVRRVASFEEPVKKLGGRRGYIDLFWKGVLLVEQKSAGRDLREARAQALEYFPGLSDSELPRHVLACDFQTFELHDLESGSTVKFALADLHEHVEEFGFVLGVQRQEFRDQDPVNIRASELVARLHDCLSDSGYGGHDLERFMVRVVFCMFADDTGIFENRGMFLELLENHTRRDGADTGELLSSLFQVLNTPEGKRSSVLAEWLAAFPCVNGDLFDSPLSIPSFDAEMRAILLEACRFDWSKISPAIFGALFQSVMDPAERRRQGAHYTTEKNILKVIEPLFLSDLRSRLDAISRKRNKSKVLELRDFHEELSRMTFFDPACGCGYFLIIAYRELRALEIDLIREIRSASSDSDQWELDAASLSRIDVDQFFGIEIIEFPARIAEVALWMMDHIMNNRLSLEFGRSYVRIPLESSPTIHHGDALEIDWNSVLDANTCSYVLGNPPFVGSKQQSAAQRKQVQSIVAHGRSLGTLDYVSAWFVKAAEYIQAGKSRIGFVATSSVTQGEQVGQLWPILLERHRLCLTFAHQTFAWGSDARGKAHVHVVILGLSRLEDAPKEKALYSYDSVDDEPHVSRHAVLSPYLLGADRLGSSSLVVRSASRPLCDIPPMVIGSKPIDNGLYIFTKSEMNAFLAQEPGAKRFFRPYFGGEEFLGGSKRWILALQDATPASISKMPLVKERMRQVMDFRKASRSEPTRKLAEHPTLYHVNVVPETPFLVIPEVSSERRDYVPIGWLEPPAVPSNLVRVIENASKEHFGLLTSSMHMCWLKHVGGRLEGRFRYSISLVYNTFPFPPVSPAKLRGIASHADAVLAARRKNPNSTLAELYDPVAMPVTLKKAHERLDRAVERLYRKKAFVGDRDRFEHLLAMYESLVSPLDGGKSPSRGKKR